MRPATLMRGAALLVPLGLVGSSCSDTKDRTYTFNETVRCLRDAGYQVDEGGEPTPPTPDTRDAIVSRGERLAFSLVFHESLERAKEISGQPSLPSPEIPGSISEHRTERRGNVFVIIVRGRGERPTTPREKQTLDRCLPRD